MNSYYAYLYCDPSRENEPIYVGKGVGKRVFSHLKRRNRHPLSSRLQHMSALGVQPTIEFLISDVSETTALFVERCAIDKYGRKNLNQGPLLNLTNGGEGSSGWKASEETKERMRLAHLGRQRPPSVGAAVSKRCKGKSLSAEHRQRIGESKRGKKLAQRTPEHSKKISDALRARARDKLKVALTHGPALPE